MLQKQYCIDSPFYKNSNSKTLKKVIVNAVGFGGNAVSVLIEL
jgi:3-oxoacyl-(acyl-carrier-protein) synthase